MKRKRQRTRLFLAVLSSLLIASWTQAHAETSTLEDITDPGLKIQYIFDNVTDKTVPDASGSGHNATLTNDASILSMGKYNVLNLGNGTGYLDMGKAAGETLQTLSNYTVSVYYRVDQDASLSGAGYFLWAFSVQSANTADNGPYVAYRLNAQRFALSTGGWNNEKGIETGSTATKDTWQHVLYRQTGTKGELYINGNLAGTNSLIPTPASSFTTAAAYNWIGRAPFSGDSYLKKTLVYDFRVYDQAASNDEIAEWAALTEDLNYEYAYGSVGDFGKLTTLVSQYKAILAAGTENYPSVATEEFKDAITLAQELIDGQKASQFLIDECVSTLEEAHERFNATEGFEMGAAFTPEYNTEKGFKHPGALHSQEDFDRVKELLAANDPAVVAAYNKLKANQYSQSNVTTYPVETIVRGGGSGENYMNAARGAAMAYQNALRWKISGNEAHAKRAVLILNSWATICKTVTGDTNQSLASGLYGYQFANAAELMRDYEGWTRAEFKQFQEWMLYLWYPRCVDFLRRRHDTWYQGTPGHYWSNWGLCNALAVMSIGVLCDDVFVYNQGVSFYKHDQVGNFTDQRTPPIDNNGLTEFIGNLIPAVHTDDRGPYGYLAQMQESGRDQGHALMALGLAADICQIGWSQGDDLFALMNNRLAAGTEYVAAYNSGTEDLPWTEYWYHDVRTAWHNSWKMGGNNEGGRGAFRPYWDRLIGHYEGVKGVSMSFSHEMKNKQTVDDGGGTYGQTSGGFDHLGFSTLMCTRPAVTPDQAPTPIIPALVYNGTTYTQNELGGLKNTFEVKPTTAIPAGSIVKFTPSLPEATTDTGNWQWDTGATTKDLEITAHNSAMYRVTYTNEKGVKSTQLYSIAVAGDCTPDMLTPVITAHETTVYDTVLTVLSRTPIQLAAWNKIGWGSYRWNNGSTSSGIEIKNINSDRTYTVIYTNQGGRETTLNFHIRVFFMLPSLSVNGSAAQETNTAVVNPGQSVELIPIVPSGSEDGTWEWNDGSTSKNLLIEDVQNTGHYSVTYTYNNEKYTQDFHIYIPDADKEFADGLYYIKNVSNDKYLTNDGVASSPVFEAKSEDNAHSQAWKMAKDGARYKITSAADGRYINQYGVFGTSTYYASWCTYTLRGVEDGDLYAIRNGGSSGTNYWIINADGTITGKGASSLNGYPFEIVPADLTSIDNAEVSAEDAHVYPNPMQDYLIVYLDEKDASSIEFTLYSVEGQTVKTVSCSAGENRIQVGDLPTGLYFGIWTQNGEKKAVKLIKQ